MAAADPIAYAAATAPATPYDPVTADTSKTMLMPIIEIDMRPANPATKNARDPGTKNSPRYAPATFSSSQVRHAAPAHTPK